MENPVYIVALVLGSLMVLSVCFVYVKHQILQLGGIVLSGFAVVLVGMSVWKTIDITANEKGFTAKLEQALAKANEATAKVAEVKEQSQRNSEAALALKTTVEAFKVQEALRGAGVYRGALDGHIGPATQSSIREFQSLHNIPQTGVIDAKTIEELNIEPVRNFPQLEKGITTP